MKKLVLAGLAGLTAVAAATPAQAHPTYHYIGGCSFFTVSDGTDSPQTKWDGEVHVLAIATDALTGAPAPAASISVDCELRINGANPGTIVLSCTAPGSGVVACADEFSFNADPDDIVDMCDNVTVGGEFHKEDCRYVPPSPTAPQEAIKEVERTVYEAPCVVLDDMSGGPADQPPVVDFRSDGDVYVNGEWFWDCPPSGISGT